MPTYVRQNSRISLFACTRPVGEDLVTEGPHILGRWSFCFSLFKCSFLTRIMNVVYIEFPKRNVCWIDHNIESLFFVNLIFKHWGRPVLNCTWHLSVFKAVSFVVVFFHKTVHDYIQINQVFKTVKFSVLQNFSWLLIEWCLCW